MHCQTCRKVIEWELSGASTATPTATNVTMISCVSAVAVHADVSFVIRSVVLMQLAVAVPGPNNTLPGQKMRWLLYFQTTYSLRPRRKHQNRRFDFSSLFFLIVMTLQIFVFIFLLP